MAMTIAGFQGTVSETQWAQIMTAVAQKYVLTSGDPVRSSGRTLLIDPRASVGAGVLVATDTITSVAVPAPTTGQWHLLVLRRTWGAARSAQYLLIPGATGPNSAQTAPPSTLPAGRNRSVGVVDDEPVAWVYARSGTTELQLWQMSAKPAGVIPGPWAFWDAAEQGPLSRAGIMTNPAAAWNATFGEIRLRVVNYDVPVEIDPTREKLQVTPLNTGNGYGFFSVASIAASSGGTTRVNGRYMQIGSAVERAVTILWRVVPLNR
ncbi:hypothetical protein Leucomu_13205 [Leucobacter muris]|uniref:Minor tail protein n=1 Tax=Leucobacter muris TaxID=1935379 RepID=A0ABX5QI14_9MICO|nr:hypothetical protein [Leucobacter muris]QAB18336.1 hypothetical protein Leucomu_10775 [Leucobacter muris]QAB18739.1 hypothetical protein Leucomu_13205 [Leucobacter muris]